MLNGGGPHRSHGHKQSQLIFAKPESRTMIINLYQSKTTISTEKGGRHQGMNIHKHQTTALIKTFILGDIRAYDGLPRRHHCLQYRQ